VSAGADDARGLGDLLRRRVRAELERPGVDAQQRHPVGEHIVHLAGDPPALRLAGLGDLEPLLGLQPLGPLPERVHELPARAHEQPPADGDRGERLAQHEVCAVAGRGRVDQREGGGGHHGHDGGRHHAAARRPRGGAEGRQQRRPGGGRRHDRREQRADRDRGRSRAPRPQGQPRGHAEQRSSASPGSECCDSVSDSAIRPIPAAAIARSASTAQSRGERGAGRPSTRSPGSRVRCHRVTPVSFGAEVAIVTARKRRPHGAPRPPTEVDADIDRRRPPASTGGRCRARPPRPSSRP